MRISKQATISLMLLTILTTTSCKNTLDTSTIDDQNFDTFEHFTNYFNSLSFSDVIEYRYLRNCYDFENNKDTGLKYYKENGGRLYTNQCSEYSMLFNYEDGKKYYENMLEYDYMSSTKYFSLHGHDSTKDKNEIPTTFSAYSSAIIDDEKAKPDSKKYISTKKAKENVQGSFLKKDYSACAKSFSSQTGDKITRYSSRTENEGFLIDFDFYSESNMMTYNVIYHIDSNMKLTSGEFTIKKASDSKNWNSAKQTVKKSYTRIDYSFEFKYGVLTTIDKPDQENAIKNLFGDDALD